MNEQLNAALTELLKTVQQTKDFAISQSPDVIRQMLLWRFIVALFWSGVGCMLIWVGRKGIQKIIEVGNNEKDDDEATAELIANLIMCIFGFALIMVFFSWLEILIAPKWYVIECIKGMIH